MPTATVVPTATPKLPCRDIQGGYNDPFKPSGNNYPPPVLVSGSNGEVIGVTGSGNALSAVAKVRVNFDQSNMTCTTIVRSDLGPAQNITDFVNGTKDGNNYQIVVTDFSIAEVNTLGRFTNNTLTDHQIAVIPYVMIVNKTLYNSIQNLSSLDILAIYQGTITNWSQLGGPNKPITAFWPGTVNTQAGNWPTNQDDLNSLSGALVSFKHNIMRGKDASSHLSLDRNKGQGGVLEDVKSTDYSIGFVSPQSLAFFSSYIPYDIPITINGYAPTADNIRAGHYVFWDIVHAYTRNDLAMTTPLGKATKAMISNLISDPAKQADVTDLSWISLRDVAQADLDCHNGIDLCPLPPSS